MGQTNVLAPEEAPVGDCEKSQAAGIDDHLAKTVTPERRADILRRIPMGRMVEVDEVARMVAWLASADCSFSIALAS